MEHATTSLGGRNLQTGAPATHHWNRFLDSRDSRSRAALIQHYRYLVRATVSRLGRAILDFHDREDLESIGNIGLIRAIDQFDAERDVQFETYAITLIRGAVLEMARRSDWAPRSLRTQQKQVREATAELASTLRRDPTAFEIARHLRWSVDEVQQAQREETRGRVLSLDELATDEGERSASVEALTCVRPAPPAEVERRERSRALSHAVKSMPAREKQVLDLYYSRERTFREIGTELGVSEVRAHQLHAQALKRLRQGLQPHHALFA